MTLEPTDAEVEGIASFLFNAGADMSNAINTAPRVWAYVRDQVLEHVERNIKRDQNAVSILLDIRAMKGKP